MCYAFSGIFGKYPTADLISLAYKRAFKRMCIRRKNNYINFKNDDLVIIKSCDFPATVIITFLTSSSVVWTENI